MPRHDGRAPGEIRPVAIERGFIRNSPGSVLYRSGATTVLVTAQERRPDVVYREKAVAGLRWCIGRTQEPGSEGVLGERSSQAQVVRWVSAATPVMGRLRRKVEPWPDSLSISSEPSCILARD